MTKYEEKSVLWPRKCTVLQDDRNGGKNTWISLHIFCVATISSRVGSQRRSQKSVQVEGNVREAILMSFEPMWYDWIKLTLKVNTNVLLFTTSRYFCHKVLIKILENSNQKICIGSIT